MYIPMYPFRKQGNGVSMENISEAFKIHDKYQFELKFAYPLDRKREYNEYFVDTYLFIPNNLGINKQTYTPDTFYRDMHKYIRLKTPAVRLSGICDGEKSPFRKLSDAVNSVSEGPDAPEKTALYEERMRLFCSIMKSALRDEEKITEARLTEDNAEQAVDAYLSNGLNAVMKFRSLRPLLGRPGVDPKRLEFYLLVDEFLSLTVNKYRYMLYIALQNDTQNREWAAAAKRRIVELLTVEIEYRKKCGYPSVPEKDSLNEKLVYRENILKKVMASVLFLKSDTRQDGVILINIVFGIAAGLAMTFATAVTFLSQSMFFKDFSLTFCVIIVVAYMFKDRIKELSRGYLYSKMRAYTYDFKTILRSSLGKEVGVCRESFSYVNTSKMKPEVEALHGNDPISFLESTFLGESVIHSRKYVKICSRNCESIYSDFQVDGLVDIIRFNVRHFLEHMDNPVRELFLPDGKGGIMSARAARVYHVYMTIRCSTGRSEERVSVSRFRLTLARNGIKRLEKIS